MTKEECPNSYFEHLTLVIMSVLAAENTLIANGKLSKDNVRGHTTQWYCEQIAEELIKQTNINELEGAWD